MPSLPGATVLVVGDVHGHWRDCDTAFLETRGQELAMFVGDLGDEDLDLVKRIAAVRAPKAVILGNHDAWQSFSRHKPTRRLRESLEALGDEHIAYAVRELPSAGLSIIGARPFSWGGRSLRSVEVYGDLFGVRTAEDSVKRIVDAARRAHHRDLMILAHNGPTGLGELTGDIYGKDFGRSPGGDWGDRDLQRAIEHIRDLGLRVRCVVAGHMHDRLLHPRGHQRTRFARRDGVTYVNPAVVPRVRADGNGGEVAHYVQMDWTNGELGEIAEIWVDAAGEVRDRHVPDVVEV